MDIAVVLATVAFVLVVLLVIVYLSIRVVQQYERMVVFRLGRTDQAMVRNPGLNFLIPVVDRPIKVDLRENLTEVPSQRTITRDNAPIDVDFLVFWRIVDPLTSVGHTMCTPFRPSTAIAGPFSGQPSRTQRSSLARTGAANVRPPSRDTVKAMSRMLPG